MRICVTRDFSKVRARMAEIDKDHPEWKYGMLISNFADQSVISAALPGWNIGNKVDSNDEYGPWFAGECKNLEKACSVFGNQGLELDCPIVVFDGAYIRQSGKWITNGRAFYSQKENYNDPDTIVENNYRVLLTRARKEMILLIPNTPILDETYEYFSNMGVDVL